MKKPSRPATPTPPVKSSETIQSKETQAAQDKFDAESAKLPQGQVVKGLSNLIRKRGL